jgi:hypothetical protein
MKLNKIKMKNEKWTLKNEKEKTKIKIKIKISIKK